VGLPDGTGYAAYLAALAEVLPGALDAFRPELILFQAGVDAQERTSLANWR
jgi:acetoin utilization deacetylase AcuC-like enzyme